MVYGRLDGRGVRLRGLDLLSRPGNSHVTQLEKRTERTLAVLYVLTFLGVLLATWAAAFGTFAIAGILNR